MSTSILGTRIRQRRRELGVTQAELARRVEISASYLNLIEWNKRRIAGTLLRKVAEALNLALHELDDVSERRLLDTLVEIAHLPAFRSLGIEDQRANELIGRFPGWARALAALARSERDATARAQNLSDRLSNDPFLGETVHRMLSRIAAIRSAAEILEDYPDVPAERRERFTHIVNEETRTLSDIGEALVVYLDHAEDAAPVLTSADEVEAMFDARQNRFPEIEAAATELSDQLSDPDPISIRSKTRQLTEEHLAPIIERIIDDQPQIETEVGRNRARRALADYGARAIAVPVNSFARCAADFGYDIEALAEAFFTDVETVCHRLAALPLEDNAPQFGYIRANAAGTIIEILGLEGLAIPRYAAACPLWALYRAQQSPETVIRQRALFPSGSRFVFVARARHVGVSGFGKPRHYVTDMLTMSEENAQHTVYAPESAAHVEEVGPGCRLCPRQKCVHRVEDPLTE